MSNRLDESIFGEDDEVRGRRPGADRPRRPADGIGLDERDRAGRGSGQARRPAGRPSLLRRALVILLALAVLGGGGVVAWKVLGPVVAGFNESDDYAGPGTGTVRVKVNDGDTGAAIAKTLVAADVVKSQKAYISAANDNPKSTGIQPGSYDLRKQMAAADAVAVLADPANRITSEVVIPEGLWASEIYSRLSEATGVPLADYEAAAKDTAALGLPASAGGNIEGYLFPASYDFEPNTSALDQLKALVANSTKRLTALGVKPEDMERIIIIASIIEGEAHRDEDRAKVSRVIYNRIEQGMSLGMDSSVNYIFKKRGVPTADMLASDSPYNTRRFTGLPPGPISNPGEAAITAAAQPADGDWLYFTTVNLETGETKFTASDAEHQANAAQFAQWCQDNPGKC